MQPIAGSADPKTPDINPEGNVALPAPNEIWSFKMAAPNDTL